MTTYFKYPRTAHVPWSLGASEDDIILDTTEHFTNKEVIVTEKLDGENTSIYRDRVHARSLDSAYHPSREWVRALAGKIQHEIPENWRISGENMYAKHSIGYDNLSSYFYVFSIWNENNECLSWDNTIEWCRLLNLEHAPVLYRGIWDEEIIKNLYKPEIHSDTMEGYVIRIAAGFHYDDFGTSLSKFVRKSHVQTDEHWMHKKMEINKLK